MNVTSSEKTLSWQNSKPEELLAIHKSLWSKASRVKFRSASHYVHVTAKPKQNFAKTFIGAFAFVTQNTLADTQGAKDIVAAKAVGVTMQITWICDAGGFKYYGKIVTSKYPDGKVVEKIFSIEDGKLILLHERAVDDKGEVILL